METKMDEEILQKLEDSTKNSSKLQQETLLSILQRNASVRYLCRYITGKASPIDADRFRQAVPLSRYEDYADYIDQLADGVRADDDEPLLSVDPLVCFFRSSGTSSKPKLIPYFDSPPSKTASQFAQQCSSAILRKLFPPRSSTCKILGFIYAGNVETTKSGCKIMAATSFPLHVKNTKRSLYDFYVSPHEVLLGTNIDDQVYCHLLCGLKDRYSVDAIRAPYAVSVIQAMSQLQSKWKNLCDDLERGFLSISDSTMGESMKVFLGGSNPNLAATIRTICEDDDWYGILPKLWPKALYIRCITTGSMAIYYNKIKHYAGDLPLLGGDYFSSECLIAMNLDPTQPPELTRYVMLPMSAYFEFLPLGEEDDAVDFSGLEVGKMYEIAVTTYRGLYRYRLGDIVRITGFHNSSPELQFLMRSPNTNTDLITEKELITAMLDFEVELVVDFASFFVRSGLKQLKIFVEFDVGSAGRGEEECVQLMKKCCDVLEHGLQGGMYGVMKEKGEVSPLVVYLVKCGSFEELRLNALRNGASASQYKPPKIIRNEDVACFLEESSVLKVCLEH